MRNMKLLGIVAAVGAMTAGSGFTVQPVPLAPEKRKQWSKRNHKRNRRKGR